MPNTLAHIGVQGFGTRAAIARPDPRWVLLGCVIPDLPWILHRVVRATQLAPNVYDLRLYAVVQSSLAFCLVLCVALSLVATRPARTFGVLALGSTLHLLLDMAQTKWANGAVLFAPFSWEVVSLGWFWSESWVTVVLTVLGLFYLGTSWRSLAPESGSPLRFHGWRAGTAVLFGALYVVLPIAAVDSAGEANAHYVTTLRDRDRRRGRYVEFDRADLETTGDGHHLVLFTGERIALAKMDPGEASVVSVRGVFRNDSTLRVLAWHPHRSDLRDLASVAGLLAVLGSWVLPWVRVRG